MFFIHIGCQLLSYEHGSPKCKAHSVILQPVTHSHSAVSREPVIHNGVWFRRGV